MNAIFKHSRLRSAERLTRRSSHPKTETQAFSRKVLCFIHGSRDDWQGICVDLDIAVQGRSFDEVKDLLSISIGSYIESALAEEPAVRDQLLNRKSPVLVRLRHALSFLWAVSRHRNNGDDTTAGFSMPCRA